MRRRMRPIPLAPNLLRRAYQGGAAIAELRGLPSGAEVGPEDWVASVTSAWGRPGEGVTRLPDGRTLPEAIAADPAGFLGPGRGDDPGLLTKLLDAGERLMVHAHPDRAFAAAHVGTAHGKTEAWIVAATRGDRCSVHLGFAEDVPRERLSGWVAGQDVPALLAAMNEVPVAAGDVLFIPAGLPHAIGEGLLIVELQEPSDLSVWIEWPEGRVGAVSDGDMGLGVETALEAVDRSAWDGGRLARLGVGRRHPEVRPGVERLLEEAADPFFAAERVRGGAELEPGYSVLVVVEGGGRLATEGGALEVGRGDTVLIPHAAGAGRLEGALVAYRCLGPAA